MLEDFIIEQAKIHCIITTEDEDSNKQSIESDSINYIKIQPRPIVGRSLSSNLSLKEVKAGGAFGDVGIAFKFEANDYTVLKQDDLFVVELFVTQQTFDNLKRGYFDPIERATEPKVEVKQYEIEADDDVTVFVLKNYGE